MPARNKTTMRDRDMSQYRPRHARAAVGVRGRGSNYVRGSSRLRTSILHPQGDFQTDERSETDKQSHDDACLGIFIEVWAPCYRIF